MQFLIENVRQRLSELTTIAAVTVMASLSATVTPAAIAATSATSVELTDLPADSTVVNQLFDTRFCADDLAATINTVVGRPQFATARWGIQIDPLDDTTTLYSRNAETLLIPASNIKLLTTATAVQVLAERDPEALWAFREELNIINRNSDNARADALLRDIGGQRQVRESLAPLGISADSFVQADGSGLSRQNQAQPATFVALLKGMYATDDSGLFYESLPVGGVNGTLRNRFKNTRAQGKVHAKTGTLNGVRALSGYLEADAYGTLVFSIVVNQSGQSGSVMLGAIDEIILQMSRLEVCD
jgi:D-alanyl-D-alanine carboxypeptidase/D-alanyl-D-alanine-endopeptidase (penicillin-binding protein 4)